jgi:hypothetical protein
VAGSKPRRSAKSAPDIEDVLVGCKPKLVKEMLGGLAAANMKLVERGEVIERYGIGRLAERFDSGTDRRD